MAQRGRAVVPEALRLSRRQDRQRDSSASSRPSSCGAHSGRVRLVSMPYLDEGGILASSPLVVPTHCGLALAKRSTQHEATIEVRSPLPFPARTPKSRRSAHQEIPTPARFAGFERRALVGDRRQGQKPDPQVPEGRARRRRGSRRASYPAFMRSSLATCAISALRFTRTGSSPRSSRSSAIEARLYLTSDPQGTPVAGGIAIVFRDLVTVPWASSLRSARPACPNHSLYWQVLEDAVAQGAGAFDFGRSTEGTGTFSFKRQWGAEPVPLLWEVYSPQGERQPATSMDPARRARLAGLWSKLPVPMATRLGSLIRRHLPQ